MHLHVRQVLMLISGGRVVTRQLEGERRGAGPLGRLIVRMWFGKRRRLFYYAIMCFHLIPVGWALGFACRGP